VRWVILSSHRKAQNTEKKQQDFLFDALHSIKWSILSLPKEQAAQNLALFEKLMRTTLTSKSNKSIALERAVISLQQYLQLENIRLEGRLNYTFKIDAALSYESKTIAPDLLQNFCEMELWSHISTKEQQHPFEIELLDGADSLTCLLRIKSKILLEEKTTVKILRSSTNDAFQKVRSPQDILPLMLTF